MNSKPIWIVDDVQRVEQIDSYQVRTDGKTEILAPLSHLGQIYAPEFVYAEEEQAREEVANRHSRLNRAFESRDLLGCLSINKEPERKSKGATPQNLQAALERDREDYTNWLTTLKKRWEQINGEPPNIEQLHKTLRNAQLMRDALDNPLAPDFSEIMLIESRPIQPNRSRIPMPVVPPPSDLQ